MQPECAQQLHRVGSQSQLAIRRFTNGGQGSGHDLGGHSFRAAKMLPISFEPILEIEIGQLDMLGGQAVNSIIATFCGLFSNGTHGYQFTYGIADDLLAYLESQERAVYYRHGFNPDVYAPWHTGGNNLAIQLVTDGLKIQGCNPTFVVGRDAILTADELLTGGDNQCTIWASFARRGLGYSADDGGTTGRNDGTEAYDTHPDCANDFAGPVAAQPAVNTVAAGRTMPMVFNRPELSGLDVLAPNSPFSRWSW